MFVAQPEDAARELARVCRAGGRLGLTTWLPSDTIEGLFRVMAPYKPPGPAMPSPFEWGKVDTVRELLGEAFDLKFEYGVSTFHAANGAAAWELFVSGYGPVKAIAAACDETRRDELRRDFIAYHDRYSTDLGISMPRRYLVTIGVRR